MQYETPRMTKLKLTEDWATSLSSTEYGANLDTIRAERKVVSAVHGAFSGWGGRPRSWKTRRGLCLMRRMVAAILV